QQFTLDMQPEVFTGDTSEAANELILEKVNAMYQEKEVTFPVSVGIHNFLLDRGASEKQSRGELIRWTCDRFDTDLKLEEFRGKSRSDIESKLIDCSRTFLANSNGCVEKLDEYLDRIYGSQNGQTVQDENGNGEVVDAIIPQPEALAELTKWANEVFHAELEPEQFQPLSRDDARQHVISAFNNRFRPELTQAERSLVLEILDTAWKDHLYFMDHLRQGIGLVGYAQKDPKTEYKREGRKAFNTMWERVGQQVTSSIFRLEQESPEFVGSLWEITSTQHEDAQIGSDYGDGAAMADDGDVPAIETIRNRGPKVGRNDPCPCNSGKKYKKCCGRA
ncbi:MAG: SEC-C domain-containing protein, partial [Planctomycetes bacterium]|nr:SEC-C domain-containing protein [Planctomycetota bacterium]